MVARSPVTRVRAVGLAVCVVVLAFAAALFAPSQATPNALPAFCVPQAHATAAYKVSPKVNKAALNYLTEMYIQEHPEMAKEIMYGSPKDKAVLKKLAGIITSGKSTSKAKCKAIAKASVGSL